MIRATLSEAYSEPCQTFKTGRFAEKPPVKSILYVWQGSRNTSVFDKQVLMKFVVPMSLVSVVACSTVPDKNFISPLQSRDNVNTEVGCHRVWLVSYNKRNKIWAAKLCICLMFIQADYPESKAILVQESRCCHLNVRYRACCEQGVPWRSGNDKV